MDRSAEGGCVSCCGSRKKQSRGNGLQLNLIVDPSLFSNKSLQHAKTEVGRRDTQNKRNNTEAFEDDFGSDTDSDSSSIASSFQIPNLENQDASEKHMTDHLSPGMARVAFRTRVEQARSKLKLFAIYDCSLSLLWLVESVYAIESGGQCPPGTLNGW